MPPERMMRMHLQGRKTPCIITNYNSKHPWLAMIMGLQAMKRHKKLLAQQTFL